MENIPEQIERLRPLFVQREAIDSQIVEILRGGVESKPAKRPYAKKQKSVEDSKAREPKADHPWKKHSTFSQDEHRNIIELYNRGESTGSIAKLMKVPAAKMYSYIFNLKKRGLISKDRPNNALEGEQT